MNREVSRYKLQLELDEKKSAKERNVLGQYSTPYCLAKNIVDYLVSLNLFDSDIDFLEPAIGTGVFFSALDDAVGLSTAVGYEIDAHYYIPAKKLWENTILEMRNGDFLEACPDKCYDLIISNPPYSRHHHIDSAVKRKLCEQILSTYGITVSGLAGLYCYFLILSTRWLKQGGVSCWLVPSEFMDVNYGKCIRQFLANQVELLAIHRFDPEDLQFSDALVSSSIVVFRNDKPKGGKVRFSYGGQVTTPHRIVFREMKDLSPEKKWSGLFMEEDGDNVDSGVPLGTYFNVSRGIATGNNSFFILSKENVEKRGISYDFLTPVLPSPRNLNVDMVVGNGSSLNWMNQNTSFHARYPKMS